MKQYFTTIESFQHGYIGKVLNPNTNQVIYTTQQYEDQALVTQDLANFLKTSKPVNNIVSNSQQPRRCCGR